MEINKDTIDDYMQRFNTAKVQMVTSTDWHNVRAAHEIPADESVTCVSAKLLHSSEDSYIICVIRWDRETMDFYNGACMSTDISDSEFGAEIKVNLEYILSHRYETTLRDYPIHHEEPIVHSRRKPYSGGDEVSAALDACGKVDASVKYGACMANAFDAFSSLDHERMYQWLKDFSPGDVQRRLSVACTVAGWPGKDEWDGRLDFTRFTIVDLQKLVYREISRFLKAYAETREDHCVSECFLPIIEISVSGDSVTLKYIMDVATSPKPEVEPK